MTDKFKGWYPDYIENEKEREPILKLAKMMTGRAKKKLGLEKMTKYDPEYWGLALLCTDEQAEIALKMGGASAENFRSDGEGDRQGQRLSGEAVRGNGRGCAGGV